MSVRPAAGAASHGPAKLPAGLTDRRLRPRLRARMRASLRTAELDAALASGADPLADELVLWRAQQLADPATRAGLVRALEMLVGEARHRGQAERFDAEIARHDLINANRSLLLILAERLRGNAPLALRGLAMVDLLVNFGNSSLYRGPSPLRLKWDLLEAITALDPHD